MSYHWGRAIFSLLLAAMSFSDQEEDFVRWVVSLYSLACFGCFTALAILDRERDQMQAEYDRQLIRDLKEPDDEAWLDAEPLPFILATRTTASETRQDRGEYSVMTEEAPLKTAHDKRLKQALDSSF